MTEPTRGRHKALEGLILRRSLVLSLAISSLVCERTPTHRAADGAHPSPTSEQKRPGISAEKIAGDLVGRAVGEGLAAGTFQKDAPRKVTVLESKVGGDTATVVITIETESKPLPMLSFPPPMTFPPGPFPTVPGQPPPPTLAPMPMPSPLSFGPRKWSGRLRLHYEWIVDEWNLVKIENLSFKLVD